MLLRLVTFIVVSCGGGRGAAVVSFVVIVNSGGVWGKRSVAADRRVCVVRGTVKKG